MKFSLKDALSDLREFLANESRFNSDEKRFSFQLKIYFTSEDIWILVLVFWSCRKTA